MRDRAEICLDVKEAIGCFIKLRTSASHQSLFEKVMAVIDIALADERERCAKIAENLVLPIDYSGIVQKKVAAAIRKGKP